jgi:hypothetical protein
MDGKLEVARYSLDRSLIVISFRSAEDFITLLRYSNLTTCPFEIMGPLRALIKAKYKSRSLCWGIRKKFRSRAIEVSQGLASQLDPMRN